MYSMNSLKDRRIKQSNKLFELVVSESAHKLHQLLPPKNVRKYNIGKQREFTQPKMRTKRFSNTFIQSMSKWYNSCT